MVVGHGMLVSLLQMSCLGKQGFSELSMIVVIRLITSYSTLGHV